MSRVYFFYTIYSYILFNFLQRHFIKIRHKTDKNLKKTIVRQRNDSVPEQIHSMYLACDIVKYRLSKRKETGEPIPEGKVRFYTFFSVNVSR